MVVNLFDILVLLDELLTTILCAYTRQLIVPYILLRRRVIYIAREMGALLSIPLLAVPSMGTVRQHKHLMAGRH